MVFELTEASTKIVKKFNCCECDRSQRLIWFKRVAMNPCTSSEEASNSSIASILLPAKLATSSSKSKDDQIFFFFLKRQSEYKKLYLNSCYFINKYASYTSDLLSETDDLSW